MGQSEFIMDDVQSWPSLNSLLGYYIEDKIPKDPNEKPISIKTSESVTQSLAAIPEDYPAEGPIEREDDAGSLGEDGPWDPEDLLYIPEPPDGGWGWVIVAASFLCNMVVDGIAYTFGIFFMEFVRYYEAPKGKTAWVGSLLSGCYLSAGPLVSALTNRFGCRAVTMVGSVVSCIAFLLSTIAPSVNMLMLTYGVMGGIGFGLIYLPAIVSVGYYFSTKRAFATGIAVCGSGMGAFIFAPVCQQLLAIYDWKGALMIMAGVALNCMVFGALMRPLEANNPPPKTKPLLQRIAEEKERQRQASLCNSQFFVVQHADGTIEKRPKFPINMEPGVHSTLYLDQFGKSPADTPIITLSPIEEARRSPCSSKDDEDEKEPMSPEQDLEMSSSLPNSDLAFYHEQPLVNGKTIPNGTAIPPSAIREIAKRKGLIPVPGKGAMKISISNITVNTTGDFKKQSPSMKFSSSGYFYPQSNRNNNYLCEEVWQRLEDEQVPLDASRRSSLHKISRKDLTRPLYRKDIFYSGSIANLPEFKQSQKDVRSFVASVISIPRDMAPSMPVMLPQEKPQTNYYCPCLTLPKSMSDTLKEMLDISLLKYPPFLLMCISNIFGMMGFYIPFVYITDSSAEKGVSQDKAAFLISIIGITNTIGRLLIGWLTDRPRVSALFVNNVCVTLCGICVFLIPFCNDYIAIVCVCTFFGLFVSAYICLTSIILVDLMGLDRLTSAFGLLSLFRGASSIVGPPLAGSIYDATGTYDYPFFISGSLLVFSALLTFMVPWLTRCTAPKPPPIVIEESGAPPPPPPPRMPTEPMDIPQQANGLVPVDVETVV